MQRVSMAISLLGAITSGAMLSLSLPPANIEWVGWFALAPLLIASQGRSAIEAMGLGLFAGMTCGLMIARLPGIDYVPMSYSPFVLLSLVLGIAAACSMQLQNYRRSILWSLGVACTGVSAEWLSTFGPLPIHLGLTQHLNTSLLLIASVFGIWGVSFLVWWLGATIAHAVMARLTPAAGFSLSVAHFLAPGALCIAILIGFVYNRGGDPSRKLRVAAIQDREGMTDPDDRIVLTRDAAKRGAKLIVWSELGLGNAFRPDDPRDETRCLAKELGVFLIVGFIDGTDNDRPFNAAALIDPNGRVLSVYHKEHLFLGERMAYQAGTMMRPIATTVGMIGMEICFDSCYTSTSRFLGTSGAQLIAIPNFDPPVPRATIHWLHTAFMPFRAAENRVATVRADGSGLSEIIAPDGRVVARAPLLKQAALVAEIPLGGGGTIFSQIGDAFAYVCIAAAIVLGGFQMTNRCLREPIAR